MGTVSRGPGIFSGFSVLLSPSLKANSKKIDFPRSFLSCALTVCAAVTAQCRIHDNDPIDGNKSLSVVDCGLVMFMATIEIVCPTLHDSEGALSSSFFYFFFWNSTVRLYVQTHGTGSRRSQAQQVPVCVCGEGVVRGDIKGNP